MKNQEAHDIQLRKEFKLTCQLAKDLTPRLKSLMSEVNKLHNIDRANQYFGVNMQKILKVFVRKNFMHEEINQVYLSLEDLQELSTFSPPTTPTMSPSIIPSETPPLFQINYKEGATSFKAQRRRSLMIYEGY